ncbi:MAG: hypothetical protein HOJ49_07335 [Nitrospina sp.]|nr:hypothetical protein [Nitrospina sp.]
MCDGSSLKGSTPPGQEGKGEILLAQDDFKAGGFLIPLSVGRLEPAGGIEPPTY